MGDNLAIQSWFIRRLSTKTSTVICFLIAICGLIALQYIFFSFEEDKLLQGMAAQNLVEDHGLTLAQVHVDDLSKVVYEPINGWPPAYSLLASFFYIILNKNLAAACFVISVLFFVAFILLLYRLLVILQFPVYLINMLVLFNGLNINDYLQQSTATDLPAMFFCLWSCYLAVVFVTNKKRSKYFGLAVGFVNAGASLLRYMYIGVSPVIPVLLIWNGWHKKDRRLLVGGFYSLAGTVLITGAMLFFQHIYTGHWLYTKPTAKGFFFSNLQQIHPFVISTFLNLDFYFVQLESLSGISYTLLLKITRIAGLLPLIILLFIVIRHSFKTRMIGKSAREFFFIAGGLVGLSIILILSYLSLRNSAHYALPGFEWVYVSENRYFIAVQIFVEIFFAWWLFVRPVYRFKKAMLLLRFVFLLFTGIEIMHGGYFATKYFVKQTQALPPLTAYDKIKMLIARMDKEAKEKNTGLVFTSNKQSFCDKASYEGIPVLYNAAEINGPVIYSSRPALLLVCLGVNSVVHFKHFLERPGVNKIYQENGFCFFTCYIEPGANK